MASPALSFFRFSEHRRDVKVHDVPIMPLAYREQATGELFFDNVFTEGTQLKFRPTDVDQSRGSRGNESDHIPDYVTTKTRWRGHQQHVINSNPHAFKWYDFGSEIVERLVVVVLECKKFIEDPSIRHQSEAGGRVTILSRNKTFGCRINFVKIYGRTERLFELVLERTDRNSAMNEALEIRPKCLEIGMGSVFFFSASSERLSQDQHPAGDTCDNPDIARPATLYDRFNLLWPIAHLSDVQTWLVQITLNPRGKVESRDAAEIAAVGLEGK